MTTDLHYSCTVKHTGTSASAPMAAAIIALVLEANPSLTWRDVQHIIVRTSQPRNLRATDWQTNGMGRMVSHSYGYGLMDSAAMVRSAKVWTLVPRQVSKLFRNIKKKNRYIIANYLNIIHVLLILFSGKVSDSISVLLQSHPGHGICYNRARC